ncbi:hypothetical protein I1900192L5_34780 [Odoribacter splanchnicus]
MLRCWDIVSLNFIVLLISSLYMQTNNINGITINPNNNPFLYNSILVLRTNTKLLIRINVYAR